MDRVAPYTAVTKHPETKRLTGGDESLSNRDRQPAQEIMSAMHAELPASSQQRSATSQSFNNATGSNYNLDNRSDKNLPVS